MNTARVAIKPNMDTGHWRRLDRCMEVYVKAAVLVPDICGAVLIEIQDGDGNSQFMQVNSNDLLVLE